MSSSCKSTLDFLREQEIENKQARKDKTMSFFDQDKSYSALPEGDYTAKVFNVDCDLTKESPKITVQYQLENNKRLFQNFNVNDKGQKFITWQFGVLDLNEKAKALVKDPETATPKDIAKSYVDASKEVIGKMVDLNVTHREYNGKTYENVKLLGMHEGKVTKINEIGSVVPGFDSSEPLPF